MLAAVFHGPDRIKLEQVPTPAAGPGELVIKVGACTICGTDVRIFRGRKTRGVRVPSILGHEFSGTVYEVGESVTGFQVGDRVAVAPVFPCHLCDSCKSGRENACENRQAMGYEFDGAFAEYVKIPAIGVQGGHVVKLAPDVSFEEAALIEPLACCINGQENAGVSLGDVVVILGSGPIGLLHVQVAKAAGARRVIVSEPNESRRQMARRVGADVVIDPTQDDLKAAVRACTGGKGADVVIVAIGLGTLVNEALHLVRKGGAVNLFAGFAGQGEATIEANLIHYNEITVTGATACSRRQYEQALRLIEAGLVDVKTLISHRFPLTEFDAALGIAERGEGIKVAVVP